MKDSTLIKLCLSISIIGLILLSLYAETVEASKIELSKIEEHLGKTITTSGTVKKITEKEGVSFIKISDNSSKTTIVIFDPPKLNISQNDQIIVTGQVKIYKSKLEIIAERIDKIN